MTFFFIFMLFLVPQIDETFLRQHRKVKIKIMLFFISINYFRMFGTGRVNKVFSPGIFIDV